MGKHKNGRQLSVWISGELYKECEQNRIRGQKEINKTDYVTAALEFYNKHLKDETSKRLSQCKDEIFYQLVNKLAKLQEIKFEHLFVDGTKIEANANKYSFVWKKSTNKYETHLLAKLEKVYFELSFKYMVNSETAEDLLKELKTKVTFPFVYGRGKRKTELQRDIEQLTELLTRKQKYEKYQATFDGRNSFSKTDPDVTFMHLKEDHMRNAQLKPAYNLQLAVEGEYITGLDVSSERSDQLTLIPLLEKMENNLNKSYQDVTADAVMMKAECNSNGCFIKMPDVTLVVNGKLLQTNKKFSQLKESQKEKINGWLYEEYSRFCGDNKREPDKSQKDIIINNVYSKIEEAEIWLPVSELYKYYESHINKFRKRYKEV